MQPLHSTPAVVLNKSSEKEPSLLDMPSLMGMERNAEAQIHKPVSLYIPFVM